MQNVGVSGDQCRVFWCPRCGTLKRSVPGFPINEEAPALVSYARDLSRRAKVNATFIESRLSIASIDEATLLPNEREST